MNILSKKHKQEIDELHRQREMHLVELKEQFDRRANLLELASSGDGGLDVSIASDDGAGAARSGVPAGGGG